jgi:DNA-binding winged helix-turn-helix (wHTH) protein
VPSTLPGSILQFGPFELDCGRFELRRNGQSLRVERKPLELLILLVSRGGQLVTRSEIAQRLWSSEVFVDTEHGINTAIRKLRHLLRDDPNEPQFIQTVTGMGYRFVAPIAAAETSTPAKGSDAPSEVLLEPARQAPGPLRRWTVRWYLAGALCLVLVLAGLLFFEVRHRAPKIQYTQLTDFTDSAVAPALSPDGRMLAFFRSSDPFLTTDQIYVKMLPNGEPKKVTSDDREKYGIAFSPDGSEIAYTVLDGSDFSTYKVSTLGGEPQLLLRNAAGLVWLNPAQLLYSRIQSGIHLGVVSSSTSGAGLRDLYFPAHERGMAHYSFPSPDRHWALVVEMTGNGDWGQCRLIALDGPNAVRTVGPAGACTAAGWSADGRQMYFVAAVDGRSHIWRQSFPDGEPQQITSGPSEEEGLAIDPDGEGLITSVGVHESAIWIHDERGDRQLSSEGEVIPWSPPPVFSADAKTLYYLVQRQEGSATELWRTIIETGKTEPVFSGIPIVDFALSSDGKQIVYTTAVPGRSTQLWIAPVDRSSPSTRVDVADAHLPHFGADGEILFQRAEGNANYLEQVRPDGSQLKKALPYPILDLEAVSPDGRWVITSLPKTPSTTIPSVMVIPLDGSPSERLCVSYCAAGWSTDGKFLFLSVEDQSRNGPGRTLALSFGQGLKPSGLPAGGVERITDAKTIPGATSIGHALVVPGKDPTHYAWVNTTVHRNLYRVSLR